MVSQLRPPKLGPCGGPSVTRIHQRIVDEVENLLTNGQYWKKRRKEGLEKVQRHDVKQILPLYKELFGALTKLDEFKEESRKLAGGLF